MFHQKPGFGLTKNYSLLLLYVYKTKAIPITNVYSRVEMFIQGNNEHKLSRIFRTCVATLSGRLLCHNHIDSLEKEWEESDQLINLLK